MGQPGKPVKFTFEQLHRVNKVRANRWHEGFGEQTGDWSGADWANAAAGEMGEACNVVKKLRRAETGHPGKLDQPYVDLTIALGEELADVVIYLDLLATYYGINLADEIIDKFNQVSDREDFPEKLGWES